MLAVGAAIAGRTATKDVSCTGLLRGDRPAVGAATADRAAIEGCIGLLRSDRPAVGAATAGRAATEGVSCTVLLRSDRPPPCPAQTQPKQGSNTRHTDCRVLLSSTWHATLPSPPFLFQFAPHSKKRLFGMVGGGGWGGPKKLGGGGERSWPRSSWAGTWNGQSGLVNNALSANKNV